MESSLKQIDTFLDVAGGMNSVAMRSQVSLYQFQSIGRIIHGKDLIEF